MRNFRWIACAVSLALIIGICFAFVSCSPDKDDDYGDLFEAMSQYYQTTGDGSDAPKITAQLVLTVPAGCSASLLDSAQTLVTVFSQRADTEIKIKYDSDYKASTKETEILLGKTDRAASADFLKGLKKNDYGYAYDGGKIVIAGHTDMGCAEAVKMFMTDLSEGIVDISNAKAIEKRIVKDSYAIDKITLNSFEISEYAIVYPQKNSLGEKELAQGLVDEICSDSGYVLSVISDKEISKSTRGICIGSTSLGSAAAVSESAVIAPAKEGHIELLAEDTYGIRVACDGLAEMILSAKSDKISKVDIAQTIAFDYGSSDIRLFIVNEAFVVGDLEKYRSTVNAVNTEAPSVALFYDCSDDVLENLENNLGEINSLGGRVFYRMADCVRCTGGQIVEHGECAVYKLTFEADNGGSPLSWVLVGVIESGECDDANKDAMSASFSAFCKESAQVPTVALFDMSSSLEEGFIDNVGFMEKKAAGYYINSCKGSLIGKELRETELSADMTADIIDSTIYFRK